MLCTLITIILTLIAVNCFFPLTPSRRFGIYRRANLLYPIKFLLFYSLLRLRKYRADKDAVAAEGTQPGYGVKSRANIAEMDCAQVLTPGAPQAVDAVYFVGASKDGNYLVAATARRPEKIIDGFWFLRIAGIGLLKAPKLPDTTLRADKEMTFGADGLRITPVEPMKHWKITYDGPMRLDGDEEKIVRVRLNVDWKSELEYFDFDTDMPPVVVARAFAKEPWSRAYFQKLQESHQTHHEQMGKITGKVKVEGYDDVTLALDSMRDHSYAKKRDWKLMHRYGLHSVYVEDGTKFCVGILCHPDIFSRMEMGYLYTPSGQLQGVTECDLELYRHGENGTPPKDYAFTFKAGGESYLVECCVVESPELFIGPEWEARVVERMCTYRVNGMEAWGFAEWEYRHRGGRPTQATE